MIIGIPKEIKNHEYRVGGTPDLVRMLKSSGHTVLVQSDAGKAIGYADESYKVVGAEIISDVRDLYAASEMILKVKEPQEPEFELLREGQILFGFLHLAADQKLIACLIESKVIAIAFDTVTDHRGGLPLLAPMSEVAGRLSIQVGGTALQLTNGGRGVLLGGVPGVRPGKVVVLGGGISGTEAAKMAVGIGAEVIVIEKKGERLQELNEIFGPSVKTLFSTPHTISKEIKDADLVVGTVLIPGKKTPKLITEEMVKSMKPGSVIVDISIDQGGCSETSRPTTHSEPTYLMHGVIHYCVTNMPGACARTATEALSNTLMPYVASMANKGYKRALLEDPHLMSGLNVYDGKVTHEGVAEGTGYPYYDPKVILK